MSGAEEEEKGLLNDLEQIDVIHAFEESMVIHQPQQIQDDHEYVYKEIFSNDEKYADEEEEEIPTGSPKYKSNYQILPSEDKEEKDLIVDDNQLETMVDKKQQTIIEVSYDESSSNGDNNIEHPKQKSMDYAFNALNDNHINQQRDGITRLFESIETEGIRKSISNYCNDNEQKYEQIYKFYETLKQHNDFQDLQLKLNSLERENSCCKRCACYSDSELVTFKVIHRDVLPNKLVLKCVVYNYGFEDQQKLILQKQFIDTMINDEKHISNLSKLDPKDRKQYIEEEMRKHIKLTVKQQDKNSLFIDEESAAPSAVNSMDVRTIEILSNPYNYNIQCTDFGTNELIKGDILCKINNMSLENVETVDVYQFLKYHPLSTNDYPLTITFKRKEVKCTQFMKRFIKCCRGPQQTNDSTKRCKSSCKCDECMSFLKNPTEKIAKWAIKFMKVSVGIVSKATAILDTLPLI